MKKISMLWDVFKLEALIACSYTYAWISRRKRDKETVLSVDSIHGFWKEFKESRHYLGCYYKEFIHTKHIVLYVDNLKTISNIFCGLTGTAWLCEKMKVNLKVEGLSDFLENDVIINNPSKYLENYFPAGKKFFAGKARITWIGDMWVRSEFGHEILSKLLVKRTIKKYVDEWLENHIKGDWVTVHYRGTDIKEKNKYRYFEIDDYITYLKKVLDSECSIFVCSDQAQFVDRMHIAFPRRVFAKDIQRSYNSRTLHRDSEYMGIRQKKDALIDTLILARANLVYTTGSGFVDAARFLNPSIKIISLDERWLTRTFSTGKGSYHGVPIPEKDLFKSLIKDY